jgi:3-(3-hydroxy-phenyl)propionate hydroxylase
MNASDTTDADRAADGAAPDGDGGPVDVVIVGFGPVGATLANMLGRDGVRVAVFERATDVYQLPRAAHFDSEIMRIFQSIDLAHEIHPATVVNPGMDFVAADGRVLMRFDTAEPTSEGWPRSFMFHQPDLERALWRGVDRYDNVTVHLGTEIVDIAEGDAGVTVTARSDAGEVHHVACRYVVGCDGARSFVRCHAGIALDDLCFDEPWLVLDTVLADGAAPDLPDRVIQFCDPARPTTFVPSAGRHRRWEFMLLPGEDPAAIEARDTVARLLAPWVTVGGDVDVIRSAVYRFHALVAERWRAGRLLLAGDACHQMPPFLGQGMCSGIRDAANLSWKLGLVLAGLAGDELLDTYQIEREPHVRAIVAAAVHAGSIICTTDPAIADARDAAMTGGDSPAREPDLPAMDLVVRHGDHPLVGSRWPQATADDDDRLGTRFALVGPLADAVDLPAGFDRWVRRITTAGETTVLLRPDRFVAAAATDAAALGASVALLLGRDSPGPATDG